MFTGIVQGMATILEIETRNNQHRIALELDPELRLGLVSGASVAVDGVCLTVSDRQGAKIFFDIMPQTCQRSTLGALQKDQLVNIERAAKFGDEIGGHTVSGHVNDTVKIRDITPNGNSLIFTLQVAPPLMPYLFDKGFVALHGASLTVCDCNRQQHTFQVHLIPETQARTTLGLKTVNDLLNLEIDAQTWTIVDTVTRLMAEQDQQPNPKHLRN